MKRSGLTIVCLLFIAAFYPAGCSNDNGSSSNSSFIPDFTFVWDNVADATNVFEFDPGNSAGMASGNLTGNEQKDGQNFEITSGSFNNRNLNFVVNRNGGISFSGSFVDNDTIQLTSSEGAITLKRNRNP